MFVRIPEPATGYFLLFSSHILFTIFCSNYFNWIKNDHHIEIGRVKTRINYIF